MARSASGDFTALQKKPVILVDFSGVTRRYCSGTFGDISANEKKYVRSLTANLGNIDPLSGISEIEEMSFEIIDKDLDVSDKIKDNDFEGRDVTVKIGASRDDDEADFLSLPTQKVRNIVQPTGLQSYIFTARDPKFNLKDDIFRSMPVTNLTADYAAASTANITVADSDPFIDPSELPDGVRAGIVSGTEIIQYTSKPSSTTFGGTITRGKMGTSDKDHSDGDEVTQALIFELLDPLQAALFVLCTTDDGSGDAYYDLNQHLTTPQVSGIGLGFTPTNLDIETWEELGWLFCEFEEHAARMPAWQRVNAKEWLQKYVFIPTSSYPYVNSSKLSVQSFDYVKEVESYSAVDDFEEGDIQKETAQVRLDLDRLINQIELRYDINPITNQPDVITTCQFDDSVTAYGANQVPFRLDLPHVINNVNINYILDHILRRWFFMWGNQTGEYQITTHMTKILIEPGDDLNISFNKFVDLLTATRGWSDKQSRVLEQRINIDINEDNATADFYLRGFTWDMLQRVDPGDFYTIEKITDVEDLGTGNGGRADVTFSATNDSTLEAEDGYWDAISGSSQAWVIWIDLEEPNVGSPAQDWHTISIGLHVQDTAGTDTVADNRVYVRYDPSGSNTRRIGFMITSTSGFTDARVKVDWYDATATGGSGERPTSITFVELWRIQSMATLSEV